MYKLLALDLDGTLLTSNKKITPRTKILIQQLAEQGTIIALASGRTMSGIRGVINELSVDSKNLYIIACNGAQIWSESAQQFIANQLLPANDIHLFRQWCHAVGIACYAQHAQELIVEDNQGIPVRAGQYSRLSIKRTLDVLLLNAPVPKMMFIEDAVILDSLIQVIPERLSGKYQCVRSEPNYYEIMVKGVNKGEACRVLAQHLSMPFDTVLAMGNERNDCEMLRFAGKGIAMGNADDIVRQCADYITTSNDEEGVANALTLFCFS